MDLDWEEGIFKGLLALRRRFLAKESPPVRGAVRLSDHHVALTTLARILCGEPVRVLPGREAGGVRGSDLLLPTEFAVCQDEDGNRRLYRLRTAVSAEVRRYARAHPPRILAGAEELTSLELACEAARRLGEELPGFARDWAEALDLTLANRPAATSLRGRERLLEEARQSALSGGSPWLDAAGIQALRRPGRRRAQRSPPIDLFGEWLEELGAGRASDEAPDGSTAEITTEAEAPATGELERVEIDRQEQEDAVLIHVFEKTETLDEYRGGGRDTDGSDSLSDHLDALQEVDLGKLVRDGTTTHSALRADLALEVEIADSNEMQGGPAGLPYDEWDGRKKRYRKGWCTVYPVRAAPSGDEDPADAAWALEALHRHRRLHHELRRRLERHRAGLRPVPRQLDGDDVDLEAVVDHWATRRADHEGDPRLYLKSRRRRRDFATTVLLDISLSTDSWNEGRRVLDVSREAVLLLGEVAHELGDRIQILAFSSETRNRCQVWHLKDFAQGWPQARGRIGALRPCGYTRIGPALRYATDCLTREPAERRLLLLVSDGKPTDYDRYEGRYGIADVRQALREAGQRDVHAHALAVDAVARDALPPMFGPNAWHVLPHPDALTEALTTVYGRLTSR